MATVRSLVCWGGRTGKSVTASNSGGLIFTSTNHGLRDGTALMFSGTTLPGNVSSIVPYYTQSLSANTFAIYTEPELTNRVAWSSAGSGVYAKSKKMLDYFAQYPGRWGDADAERCYDSIVSWHSARSGAGVSSLDSEVCELGQAFVDIRSDATIPTISIAAATVEITSRINGVRTEAFHYGQFGAGYELYRSASGYDLLKLSTPRTTVDGWTVSSFAGYYGNNCVNHDGWGCVTQNMIIIGGGGTSTIGTASIGIWLNRALSKAINNLVVGCLHGIRPWNYLSGIYVANNTVTKCGTGMSPAASTNMQGEYYNNISIGNTTNWGALTINSLTSCGGNAGLSGEAWVSGANPQITIATTDFVNFPTDMRPALSTSPQVDSGVEYYGALGYDIADAERPNYNNGGAEAFDVGCYEFDHGYGDHPITASLTLTGLVSGTDVVVRAAGTSTILDSVDSTSGNWTYSYGSAHNVDIDVIKPGMVIVTFRNLALTAAGATLPVSQQFDRNYS